MVNYNTDGASKGFDQFKRRSTNREVDPSSAPKFNKSPLDDKTSSGFGGMGPDPEQQAKGLGSPTKQANKKDDDDDKEVGGFSGFLNKFFGAAEASGLEFTKPDRKPKPSIYDKDDMKPIDIDAQMKRIEDAVNYDLAEPFTFKDDEYAASTYDEVKDQNIRQKSVVDVINTAIDNTSATGDYKVRKGDTLSEIAEAAGTTVRQLQLINNIPDPRKMQAGSKLRVPATTSQDKEIIESATKMSDLKPLRFANQSMMTGDQRRYFPEDTAGLNNPQTREDMLDDPATRGFGGMGPDPSTGKGIMSPPDQLDFDDPTKADTDVRGAPKSFSNTVDATYTDFVDNEEEGSTAHVGQEGAITLMGGVVADNISYDGQKVTNNTGYDAATFDPSKLDASKATKEIYVGKDAAGKDKFKTIKREDYYTDEEFTKAVLDVFEDTVAKGAGTSYSDMSDGAKKAMVKLSWNNGTRWSNYNTSKALFREMAKDTKDMEVVKEGILNYSTVAGSGASIGVSKARANAWNAASDEHGGAEITKITADNTGTKTKFKYYDAAGNLVHTETTSRSPSIYASTATTIEKDAEGNW